MYKKILVPLDGSKTAEAVLVHAKALAYSEGAEIVLLNVASNPGFEFAFEEPGLAARAIAEQEDQARTYIAEVEARLKSERAKVSSLVREGSVADVILEVAHEIGADVIAMSTHGRTGAARWLIGSVADRVVRHSPIPVMLIRPQ